MKLAKWPSLALLSLCEVMAMCLWFTATAILPALKHEYALSDLQASLFASSVSVGFVVGTLASAVLGLADRLDPRRFFAVSAIVAAAANAGLLWIAPTAAAAPVLRFIVGACAAGLYPVAMKMASTWARLDMGLLVGLIVGAQTLGLASPHLIDAFGGLDWRMTVIASSIVAALSALLIGFVSLGPGDLRATAFTARLVLEAWRRPALRLANFGYWGHMWELFAMWAWVGLFLDASFAVRPGGEAAGTYAKIVTFLSIAAGGLGCLLGGWLADRWGRTTLTIGAMAVSGGCALVVGLLFGADPWLVAAMCILWGATVVADSPQFTSCVIELAEPTLVGTMITAQVCAGFLLTTLTIHLTPVLVGQFGWSAAFAVLALGPIFGIYAMARLRRHPDAVKLAGGNR
jgi:MFS family permease